MGVPMYADACTSKVDRISYARVLVEVDGTRKLLKTIKVVDPNGREFTQTIIYDWVPVFCSKCMQIGNKCIPNEQ